MSRLALDHTFAGRRVPPWLRRFEAAPEEALRDLLLGGADLGHLNPADPEQVLLDWIVSIGPGSGLMAEVDRALAVWIERSWGDPDLQNLGAAEYTLATIVNDVSGSVASFRAEMEAALREIIGACKYSPRADNLLVRLVTFADRLDEVHGFKLLEQCRVEDYRKVLRVGGNTALYDSAENAVAATADYGEQLTRAGYAANRHDFNKLIWKTASPAWHFDDATYDRSAAAFDNPDHVDIVVHNYRWRLSLAPGEPQYEAYERKLAAGPAITVPAITIASDFDGAAKDGKAYRAKYTGKYEHRILDGIGHNVPQEAPHPFAQAILDAARM